MKKKYMAPEFSVQLMEAQNIIALSLKGGSADDSAVLVKDGGDWDIWGGDEAAIDEE